MAFGAVEADLALLATANAVGDVGQLIPGDAERQRLKCPDLLEVVERTPDATRLVPRERGVLRVDEGVALGVVEERGGRTSPQVLLELHVLLVVGVGLDRAGDALGLVLLTELVFGLAVGDGVPLQRREVGLWLLWQLVKDARVTARLLGLGVLLGVLFYLLF